MRRRKIPHIKRDDYTVDSIQSPIRLGALLKIAEGYETVHSISGALLYPYDAVAKARYWLVSVGLIKRFKTAVRNPHSVYKLSESPQYVDILTLTKRTRWLLERYNHKKVFIENRKPYLFKITDYEYVFEDFAVGDFYMAQWDEDVAVIQKNAPIEEILNDIDNQRILSRYLPCYIVRGHEPITKEDIEAMVTMAKYDLPLYYFDGMKVEPAYIRHDFPTLPDIQVPSMIRRVLGMLKGERTVRLSARAMANVMRISEKTLKKNLVALHSVGLLRTSVKNGRIYWRLAETND